MSQAIATDDILQATLEGVNEFVPWAAVFHFRVVNVTDTPGLLADIGVYYDTVVAPALGGLLSDQWTADCVTVTRVAPGPRSAYFYSFPVPQVGSVGTDGVPNGSALVLSFISDFVGPSGRGRKYICGLPEASTNGGLLLAASLAAWQAVADSLYTLVNLTNGDLLPVIFSRTIYNPAAVPPQAVGDYSFEITLARVNGNLGSQRRRRARRNTFG